MVLSLFWISLFYTPELSPKPKYDRPNFKTGHSFSQWRLFHWIWCLGYSWGDCHPSLHKLTKWQGTEQVNSVTNQQFHTPCSEQSTMLQKTPRCQGDLIIASGFTRRDQTSISQLNPSCMMHFVWVPDWIHSPQLTIIFSHHGRSSFFFNSHLDWTGIQNNYLNEPAVPTIGRWRWADRCMSCYYIIILYFLLLDQDSQWFGG